ncbi:hypothetical protein Tco_1394609 [Tanacetum coccineum]
MKRGFSVEQTPLFPSMLAIQAEEGKGSGHAFEPQPPPSTAQPIHEEPIPNVVSSLSQKTQTPRQALQEDTQLSQTRPDFKEWDDIVVRATTTAASLDATHTSGNITKTQSTTIPNVPLPQGIGTGGSPRCQEAIRVSLLRLGLRRAWETDLKQSKQVYGAAYTKLIMKVKKLEKTVKSNQARRRAKIVVSDDEEDLKDSSKQGKMIEEIDQDAGITLVTPTKDSSQEDQPKDQLGVFSAAKRKKVYGAAYTKLIMKVKKFEKTVKSNQARRGSKIVVLDEEEDLEDSSKQRRMIEEIDQDAGVTLVTPTHSQEDQPKDQLGVFSTTKVLADVATNVNPYTRRRRAVSTGSGGVSTASRLFSTAEESVSTAGASIPVSTAGMVQEVNIKDKDRERASELAARSSQATITDSAEVGSSKRAAELELDHEVPVEEVYVKALHVKYPIIDWEVYSEDTRRYWRIIRVGNHTEAYQIFADMLKKFNRDDLVKLWDLVKERFSITEPTYDKEKELWVDLKRLFEPDSDDTIWKLQRYMHDHLVWRLYDTCGVHHVSSVRGHDIFMLVEKDYPLSKGVQMLMLSTKLLVEQHSKMANELLRKIFIQANRSRQ